MFYDHEIRRGKLRVTLSGFIIYFRNIIAYQLYSWHTTP